MSSLVYIPSPRELELAKEVYKRTLKYVKARIVTESDRVVVLILTPIVLWRIGDVLVSSKIFTFLSQSQVAVVELAFDKAKSEQDLVERALYKLYKLEPRLTTRHKTVELREGVLATNIRAVVEVAKILDKLEEDIYLVDLYETATRAYEALHRLKKQ